MILSEVDLYEVERLSESLEQNQLLSDYTLGMHATADLRHHNCI